MGFIKNNLLKAIEWQDPSKNTILYKFPMDGRTIQFGSKLTVRDSQVAIFMNKGKIADVFGPGMHTLKTSNLPILTQLLALPFGFKSPFMQTCSLLTLNNLPTKNGALHHQSQCVIKILAQLGFVVTAHMHLKFLSRKFS